MRVNMQRKTFILEKLVVLNEEVLVILEKKQASAKNGTDVKRTGII